MKKKVAFLITLWWVVALMAAGVLLLIVSEKESTASNAENRYLQGFPEVSAQSLTSGDFMNEFESFLSDAFFGRDDVVGFTDGLVNCFNLLSEDEKAEMKNAAMEAEIAAPLQKNTEETAAETDDTGTAMADESNAEEDAADEFADAEDEEEEFDVEPGSFAAGDIVDGTGFLISENRSYLWYKKKDGTSLIQSTYKRENLKTYSDTLKLILSYLPEDGNVLFTQVPLASIANKWYDQQKTYTGWGSSVESMLREYTDDEDRIHIFNTFEILEPYVVSDTFMFYHNDHHWTAEGAYLVCSEMLKEQGLPVISYDEYDYKSQRSSGKTNGIRDYYNIQYPLLPTVSQVITRRTHITEIPVHNYSKNTYRAFINSTQLPYRRFLTGADTGRKCLIICDSFGNDFAPYLFAYYDEVHMCDFRPDSYDPAKVGGTIGEQIRYYGIDDVYIITSTANGLQKQNSLVNLRKIVGE